MDTATFWFNLRSSEIISREGQKLVDQRKALSIYMQHNANSPQHLNTTLWSFYEWIPWLIPKIKYSAVLKCVIFSYMYVHIYCVHDYIGYIPVETQKWCNLTCPKLHPLSKVAFNESIPNLVFEFIQENEEFLEFVTSIQRHFYKCSSTTYYINYAMHRGIWRGTLWGKV